MLIINNALYLLRFGINSKGRKTPIHSVGFTCASCTNETLQNSELKLPKKAVPPNIIEQKESESLLSTVSLCFYIL